MPLRNITTLLAAMLISVACYQKAVRNRHAAMISEAMQIIERQYVEDVQPQQLFEDAMKGMLGGLDQYSSFISSSDFEEFQEALDQEFGGVGIIVELDPQSKRLTVMSPLVGTPAYRAGLRAGDTILEIDGEDTEGMTLKDSVKLMRGAPGSQVAVKIQHAGEPSPQDYSIRRDIIPIDSVLGDTRDPRDGSWNYVLESHPHIGYIRLTTFGEMSVDELRDALLQYQRQPVQALILDVRSNAGGLLSTAVEICDMFISEGKIVSTRGRDGTDRDAYYARRPTVIDEDLPMVVMTNEFSASASEILAACLQDHERATIVGQRSWGKGTVQNVITMEAGKSALKLTTASYWRPSGQNIHRRKDADPDGLWGVRPDEGMDVELTDEQFKRMVEARRSRDVVRPLSAGSGSLLPPVEPAPDPQLLRALEHLQNVLRNRPRQSAVG